MTQYHNRIKVLVKASAKKVVSKKSKDKKKEIKKQAHSLWTVANADILAYSKLPAGEKITVFNQLRLATVMSPDKRDEMAKVVSEILGNEKSSQPTIVGKYWTTKYILTNQLNSTLARVGSAEDIDLMYDAYQHPNDKSRWV